MITVSNALDESPATVEDALPSGLPRYQPVWISAAARRLAIRCCNSCGATPAR